MKGKSIPACCQQIQLKFSNNHIFIRRFAQNPQKMSEFVIRSRIFLLISGKPIQSFNAYQGKSEFTQILTKIIVYRQRANRCENGQRPASSAGDRGGHLEFYLVKAL